MAAWLVEYDPPHGTFFDEQKTRVVLYDSRDCQICWMHFLTSLLELRLHCDRSPLLEPAMRAILLIF